MASYKKEKRFQSPKASFKGIELGNRPKENKRELISNGNKSLEIQKKESGTFQDKVARLFNSLAEEIRNCSDYITLLSL